MLSSLIVALLLATRPAGLPPDPYVRYVRASGPVDVSIEFGAKNALIVEGQADLRLTRQTLHVAAKGDGPRPRVRLTVGGFLGIDASGDATVELIGYRGRVLTVRARDRAKVELRGTANGSFLRLDVRDQAQVDAQPLALSVLQVTLAGAARASARFSGLPGCSLAGALRGTSELSIEGKVDREAVTVEATATLLRR